MIPCDSVSPFRSSSSEKKSPRPTAAEAEPVEEVPKTELELEQEAAKKTADEVRERQRAQRERSRERKKTIQEEREKKRKEAEEKKAQEAKAMDGVDGEGAREEPLAEQDGDEGARERPLRRQAVPRASAAEASVVPEGAEPHEKHHHHHQGDGEDEGHHHHHHHEKHHHQKEKQDASHYSLSNKLDAFMTTSAPQEPPSSQAGGAEEAPGVFGEEGAPDDPDGGAPLPPPEDPAPIGAGSSGGGRGAGSSAESSAGGADQGADQAETGDPAEQSPAEQSSEARPPVMMYPERRVLRRGGLEFQELLGRGTEKVRGDSLLSSWSGSSSSWSGTNKIPPPAGERKLNSRSRSSRASPEGKGQKLKASRSPARKKKKASESRGAAATATSGATATVGSGVGEPPKAPRSSGRRPGGPKKRKKKARKAAPESSFSSAGEISIAPYNGTGHDGRSVEMDRWNEDQNATSDIMALGVPIPPEPSPAASQSRVSAPSCLDVSSSCQELPSDYTVEEEELSSSSSSRPPTLSTLPRGEPEKFFQSLLQCWGVGTDGSSSSTGQRTDLVDDLSEEVLVDLVVVPGTIARQDADQARGLEQDEAGAGAKLWSPRGSTKSWSPQGGRGDEVVGDCCTTSLQSDSKAGKNSVSFHEPVEKVLPPMSGAALGAILGRKDKGATRSVSDVTSLETRSVAWFLSERSAPALNERGAGSSSISGALQWSSRTRNLGIPTLALTELNKEVVPPAVAVQPSRGASPASAPVLTGLAGVYDESFTLGPLHSSDTCGKNGQFFSSKNAKKKGQFFSVKDHDFARARNAGGHGRWGQDHERQRTNVLVANAPRTHQVVPPAMVLSSDAHHKPPGTLSGYANVVPSVYDESVELEDATSTQECISTRKRDPLTGAVIKQRSDHADHVLVVRAPTTAIKRTTTAGAAGPQPHEGPSSPPSRRVNSNKVVNVREKNLLPERKGKALFSILRRQAPSFSSTSPHRREEDQTASLVEEASNPQSAKEQSTTERPRIRSLATMLRENRRGTVGEESSPPSRWTRVREKGGTSVRSPTLREIIRSPVVSGIATGGHPPVGGTSTDQTDAPIILSEAARIIDPCCLRQDNRRNEGAAQRGCVAGAQRYDESVNIF